ncbi:Phosphoenolpyruvate/pyruvate domain-containing protein [Rhizopogon salebrosus TDB-379]|nr:Phosphoenolpyruvate/pyruvate domain-containing protein [Rhizopogon salebrosus TDB-379]
MDPFDGDEGTLFMQIVLCPGDESILESLSLGPRVERSETVNRNDALFGARGVLVPMVSNAEKAREVVSDCRFPPKGRRGFGSPFTHGHWGISAAEYIKSANDHIVIMIQIETEEAVQNIDTIAAVDGVDCLFIGPYDLSLCLGYPPPSPDTHPDVEVIIQDILKATHKAGKKCAIYCSSGRQAIKRAEEGFDFISVTSDIVAITESISDNLAVAIGGQ